jgi:hypothetical protein
MPLPPALQEWECWLWPYPPMGKLSTRRTTKIPQGFERFVFLDLNHDGINDFTFSNFMTASSSRVFLWVKDGHPGNAISSTGAGSSVAFASALPAGKVIGPNGKFVKGDQRQMDNNDGPGPKCEGPWIQARELYLGLEFVIKGEIHFGWARLNVNCGPERVNKARLTGYAYETVANKAILAGDMGPDASADDPGTLGNLARGAAAIFGGRDQQTTGRIH